jgi:hypothetical protein
MKLTPGQAQLIHDIGSGAQYKGTELKHYCQNMTHDMLMTYARHFKTYARGCEMIAFELKDPKLATPNMDVIRGGDDAD